jgi:site-specific DNA-methyltransferase (adenine-specific)
VFWENLFLLSILINFYDGGILKVLKMTLLEGNCLDILPTLEDKSIDIILTDPPYNFEAFGGGFYDLEDENARTYLKKLNDLGCNKFNPIEFLSIIQKKLSMFNGVFFCNKFLLDVYLKFARENDYLFDVHTMIKSNPIPAKNNHFLHDTEYIVVIKEKRSYFNNNLEFNNYRKWFKVSTFQDNLHPAQKPIQLIKKYIQVLSKEGDIVIDPFLGSGTTMKACLETKRNCIGIEIEPKYIEITKKRLNWGSSLGNVEFCNNNGRKEG